MATPKRRPGLTCTRCGGPLRSDSKTDICKKNRDCYNASQRASRLQYPEQHAKYTAQKRGYYHSHRDLFAVRERSYRYGIAPDEWESRLAAYGYRCAICRRAVKLCTDHDRACCPGPKSCGRCVRGPLCGPCNARLGHAERNPGVPMTQAEIDYIRYWSK